MTTARKVPVRHPKFIRYAIVGLGHITQVAVLPVFAHAASNSRLTALVSNDPKKLEELRTRYRVPHTYSYKQYDQCLRQGHIDAVYIALPNTMHCAFAVRAAQMGIHVLIRSGKTNSGERQSERSPSIMLKMKREATDQMAGGIIAFEAACA